MNLHAGGMNLDGGFRKVGMNLHEDRSMNFGHGDGNPCEFAA